MNLYEKLSPQEKAVVDEVMQMRESKEYGIIRKHNHYSIFRRRNWYEIEYISPASGASIGTFPLESAAVEVFERVKELPPSEAQKIALDYALEHFPEQFKTHIPCEMNF